MSKVLIAKQTAWSELAFASSAVPAPCALHVVSAAEAAHAKLHPGHRPCLWEQHQFSTEEHIDHAMASVRLHARWHRADAASADAILITQHSFSLWCLRQKSVPTDFLKSGEVSERAAAVACKTDTDATPSERAVDVYRGSVLVMWCCCMMCTFIKGVFNDVHLYSGWF